MKFLRTLLLYLFVAGSVFGQTKTLQLEDVILKGYQFYPQRLTQLQWVPGTDDFVFIKQGDDAELVKGNVENETFESIAKLSAINSKLEAATLGNIKSFPRIGWVNLNTISFWKDMSLISYNLTSGELKIIATLPEEAENIEFQKENFIAYTIGNNLFLHYSGKDIQITSEENSGIVSGQSVSRSEFGIRKGIFWSPDNKYLAFYQKDESKVTKYPLVDISTRPASLKNIKYPMAGMTSENVKVGVYDLQNNSITWLQTGDEKEQYLTNVTWSPDEKSVYIAHLNRDQNHMRLVKYDAKTGAQLLTLFEEKDDKYVEPEHGPIFIPGKNNQFVWFSERDEWRHLYLYNTNGELIKQMTKGNWIVLDVEGFDETGENIYFTSTKESPIETQLYKLNLSNNEIKKLTTEKGTHSVSFSSNGKYVLDTYSNLTTPSVTNLKDGDGKIQHKLNESPNPLSEYKIGETKLFTLNGNGGYKFYCRIILPTDFDSTKKYPAIVYVYGGPHDQLVVDNWLGGGSLWFNYMAENGYIVFTLDNRGSDNRGLQFEQETFRNLGTKEIEDQKLGVDYLKTLPYVDTKNLGVFGWSYGGFMTTSLMTRTPDLFKVGVAGGAVIDWSYYEVMYGERYMDTPEQNPEGYKNSSLLNYVDSLKGKLLLVHGTMDPTVVWQNTLLFAEKAARLGKPLDYFPYVGHGHGVRGKDAFHLYQKITNYFNDNLK
ncbi:MAG: DPP IV N-terminal domain-containing protein [Ignavibacteriaceae bacterium]|nr:DPP IV N-terminal domain-containing protein [Ignavibacteriaceae bacterium]